MMPFLIDVAFSATLLLTTAAAVAPPPAAVVWINLLSVAEAATFLATAAPTNDPANIVAELRILLIPSAFSTVKLLPVLEDSTPSLELETAFVSLSFSGLAPGTNWLI